MGKIKEFFQNKGVGFYLSLVFGVIALVVAIIYISSYGNYRSNDNKLVFSWLAFAMLLVIFAAPILLSLFKLERFAPFFAFVAGLLGLVGYVYRIYYHASVLFAGIELQNNKTTFFMISALMVVVFLLTLIAFFLPQNKKVKE